jgi:hypothetical protein
MSARYELIAGSVLLDSDFGDHALFAEFADRPPTSCERRNLRLQSSPTGILAVTTFSYEPSGITAFALVRLDCGERRLCLSDDT